MVALNENGQRIGETHHRARLTNHDVDLIMELIDDADECRKAGRGFLTDSEIADKFEIAKSTVHAYRHGLRRCQIPVSWKRIKAPGL